jgi:hypothetical protein
MRGAPVGLSAWYLWTGQATIVMKADGLSSLHPGNKGSS